MAEQAVSGGFVVLNDEPVENSVHDLLEAADTANSLADLIRASRHSTPFTIAIDAGWGMGKSSLMRLLRSRIETEGVPTVWFNAWTSGTDALEVLIKSVLLNFDTNLVRRAYHRIAQRRRVLRIARLALTVTAGFFGLRRLVDGLWAHLSVDAQSRQEIRDVVRDLAHDWVDAPGSDGRQVVVFIDDLDRCSGEVAMTVCESIKLYLDVPGLVFVIGCDQEALAQDLAGADNSQVMAYIEKIVQVNYRAPVPEPALLRRMIEGYAARSGTGELFDDNLVTLISQRTKRNPRRIKRLINSFVLEYHLDSLWRDFGSGALVRVILLQHFYPEFYRLLVSGDDGDPAGEFLGYFEARSKIRTGTPPDDRFFQAYGFDPPDADASRESLMLALNELEQELPVSFPALASDTEFVSLVQELSVDSGFTTLRSRLWRAPMSNKVQTSAQVWDWDTSPEHSSEARRVHLAGLRVLWIDDRFIDQNTGSVDEMRRWLAQSGARVESVRDIEAARKVITESVPDIVISDVTRFGDENAGFNDVRDLHASGEYTGPVIFFAQRITPARIRRTEELGAMGITANLVEVQRWIEVVAGKRGATSGA